MLYPLSYEGGTCERSPAHWVHLNRDHGAACECDAGVQTTDYGS